MKVTFKFDEDIRRNLSLPGLSWQLICGLFHKIDFAMIMESYDEIIKAGLNEGEMCNWSFLYQ